VLYGMGGSHYVNRTAEPLYRELAVDCFAMPASEALMAPLPEGPRTALIASQSGESGEIVELLAHPAGREERFAMTLNAASTLGRSCRGALVASGGPEAAFAATRSIILTVALHGAVLQALGAPQAALASVLAADRAADVAAAAEALAACEVVAFAGRHVMQGVAQIGALSMMELARVPTIGWEAGQFRHGPYEFLRPGIGVVLLRSAGPDADAIAPIAAAAAEAGCTMVLFDAAAAPPPPRCLVVPFGKASGLAAAAEMMLAFQRLNILIARRRVGDGAGTPLRTSKVTV
jgi:fructoselysine-6-P-deglycase FrlB-like protein